MDINSNKKTSETGKINAGMSNNSFSDDIGPPDSNANSKKSIEKSAETINSNEINSGSIQSLMF